MQSLVAFFGHPTCPRLNGRIEKKKEEQNRKGGLTFVSVELTGAAE